MGTNYNPKIVTNGLALCLDAGNRKSYPGSGTTWTDLSGNGNNGTLTNGPTFSSTNGGSLVFDGVDDYINLGTSGYTLIRSATTMTIITILYGTGYGSTSGTYSWAPYFSIDNYGLGNNYRKISLGLDNNNGIERIFCTYFNGLGASSVNGFITSPLNKILHIASTIDSVNNIMYLNGNLVNQTSGITVNSNPQTSEFTIGARINTPYDGYFKGNLYLMQIYNRALTAAEIQQNFNATRSRYGI